MFAIAGRSSAVAGRSWSSSVGIADHFERVREVLRIRGLVLDVLPRVGVLEAEAYGVQPLPLEADPPGERGVRAVGQVAHARVLERGHVDPDLVGAPGLEVDLEQAGEAVRLERLGG